MKMTDDIVSLIKTMEYDIKISKREKQKDIDNGLTFMDSYYNGEINTLTRYIEYIKDVFEID